MFFCAIVNVEIRGPDELFRLNLVEGLSKTARVRGRNKSPRCEKFPLNKRLFYFFVFLHSGFLSISIIC